MTDTHYSGPLFDGRAATAGQRFLEAAVQEVANQGLADVQENANKSFKHPTPYYETQIYVRRDSWDENTVSDRGIVYGPWLEGTSSRNQSTRFKGYASFRRAAQGLDRKAGDLVEHVLQSYLGRMQ